MKNNHNRNKICADLVSKELTESIAARRAEWINLFFYKFHLIGDLAKDTIARETLSNEKDKKEALLGTLSCQR